MKIHMILGLSIGCACFTSVWADEPIEPAMLGSFDAAVAFCSQIYPDGESAYKALRATMVRGIPSAEVQAITQRAEYRDALEAGGKELAQEPHDSAVRKCIELMPAGKLRAPHGTKKSH